MQGNVIRPRAHIVDRHQLDAEPGRDLLRDVRIVRDEAHAEWPRAQRDFLADAPQPGDTQRLAAQLGAEKTLLLPAPLFHRAIRSRNRASQPEHKGARMLGHADAVRAGRVDDEDASLTGGGHIDVVHAGPGARDDAQLWRRVHQPRVDCRRAADEQPVSIREIGGEGRRRTPWARVHHPARLRSDQLQRRGWQVVGDNNSHEAW